MLRYCILTFSICIVSASVAQEESKYDRVVPNHAVKYSPLHLLNFYSTVQLAYERRLGEKTSLQLDAGYIVDLGTYDREATNRTGFKVKLEPRYYFGVSYGRTFSWYAALEGYYHRAKYNRMATRQECFDTECQIQFLRRFQYAIRYREPGVGFKVGFVKYFDKVMMDINTGWAVRFVSYEKPSFTPGFNEMDWSWGPQVPNETSRVGVMPLLGFRLGYSF